VNKFTQNLLTLSPLVGLFVYWVFVFLGVNLSFPIQVIPDETSQLLNIYGLINSGQFKLPYETYYTVWVHYSFLPFTIIYWFFDYFLIGMPSIEEFKIHVAANYIDVLPFLRSVSAFIFLFSAWLVSNVIADKWSQKTAFLFLFFLVFDLLLFINLHYSKHWVIDFAWIFISIYLYWAYLKNRSNLILFLAGFFFCIAIFSSHPLIIAGLYHIYLLSISKPTTRHLIKDISIISSIFILMLILTMWLGPGKILSEIFYSGTSSQIQPNISFNLIGNFLIALFDYNLLLTIFFIFSIGYAVVKRKLKLFFLLIPFICYLLLISTYHFEPRYLLFLIISMSLVSAVVISKINNKFFFNSLLGLMFFVNLTLLICWHLIIVEKDTRIMALDWIKNNTINNSFVIYNTLGFNYYPLSKQGINFIGDNFPNAIGSREKLHLSLGLPDGINGIILRKIEEGKYNGPKLISKLIKSGYEPILINERFGFDAYFHQPAPTTYESILRDCTYSIESIYLPYDVVPKNFEKYGDILYNFSNVIISLLTFERPGPIMTIYKFNQNQPKSCL